MSGVGVKALESQDDAAECAVGRGGGRGQGIELDAEEVVALVQS